MSDHGPRSTKTVLVSGVTGSQGGDRGVPNIDVPLVEPDHGVRMTRPEDLLRRAKLS
jgi:hypothetical protein